MADVVIPSIANNSRTLPVDGSTFATSAGVYIAVAGNIQFTCKGGYQSPVIAVTAGQVLPFRIVSLSASTTAVVLGMD